MRRRLAWVACLVSLAVLAAGQPRAQEGKQKPSAGPPTMKQPLPGQAPDVGTAAAGGAARVASTMGEIGRRAAYGQDGPWLTTASPDGFLVYANAGDAGAWNATIIQPPRLPYMIEVEVRSGITPAPGRAVGAGITFAFQRSDDPGQRSFYALLIAGDTVYAYRYAGGSFSRIVRNTSTELGGKPWSTLRVTVQQDGFALALDGEEFTSMSAGGPLTGDVGVMVSGAGDAAFRNLRLQ